MPHTHTTPNHTHNLEYGIYKEPTLAVSGIRVEVDGAILDGVYGLDKEGLDIIPNLRRSGNYIDRGMHTIKFYPVASGANKELCRISAQVFIQCFIQSRSDYKVFQ